MKIRIGRKINRKKGPETESCPGYTDVHGQWNNGFDCPKWGRLDQKYCCGTDQEPFCCPPEKEPSTGPLSTHIPLIVGLVVGSVVLVTLTLVIACFFCRCCVVYKRRKRLNQGHVGSNGHMAGGSRGADYAVNYSVCPHQPCYNDPLHHAPIYPLEDPPPYSAEPSYNTDEKQPLNPSELYVTTDGPDNTPVTMAVPSNRNYTHSGEPLPGSSSQATSGHRGDQSYNSRSNALPNSLVMPFGNLDTLNSVSQTSPDLRELYPCNRQPYLIRNPAVSDTGLSPQHSNSDQTLSSLEYQLQDVSEDEDWSHRRSHHSQSQEIMHPANRDDCHSNQSQHRSLPLIDPRDYQLNVQDEGSVDFKGQAVASR